MHKVHNKAYPLRMLRRLRHAGAPLRGFIGRNPLQRTQQRLGNLLFLEIQPHRFSQCGRRLAVVQDIVLNLESRTQQAGKAPHSRNRFLACPGRYGRRRGRSLEQRRRFAVDNAEVVRLGGVPLAGFFHLQQFPFREVMQRPGKDAEHPLRLLRSPQDFLHAVHQPVIAHEHRRATAQEFGSRGNAAALHRPVHHVVVQEGGIVQELRSSGKAEGIFRDAATGIRNQQCQHGAQHFAGMLPQTAVNAVQQGNIRAQRRVYPRLYAVQIGPQIGIKGLNVH